MEDVIKLNRMLTEKFMKKIKENTGKGKGTGTLQTPESKRAFTRAKKVNDEAEELEEEQVHPDDKIGQAMLKKTGTPSTFTSGPGQEVHQKKIGEKIEESCTHPDDQIGQMMLKKMGVPNYFETKGIETHQKRVDKDDEDPEGKKGNPPKKYKAIQTPKN